MTLDDGNGCTKKHMETLILMEPFFGISDCVSIIYGPCLIFINSELETSLSCILKDINAVVLCF